MDKQKKTLLCMYVDDFCGIEKESFNFYVKRRYEIHEDKNGIGKISRKNAEEIKDFPNDFWGIDGSRNNVSAVTLLIGENGAGKTTLMRLLIKWLCQLSAGNLPLEKGALVISVGSEDKLIAFDGGGSWPIKNDKNAKIECIEDKSEIKKLLCDIRLAYYTDTMTDLELSDTLTDEELAFLQDDSLLTRLSNTMLGRFTADSVKDCIKREDFKRQMELFLYSQENPEDEPSQKNKWKFPIHYMKLTALKVGDENGFKQIPDGNSRLIGEAIELWNNVFTVDANNENLPDITKALLWGLFSGAITSLLRWEKTLPYLEASIITEPIRSSLRAYIRTNSPNYDWSTVFIRFFGNVFSDCEKEFNAIHRSEEFYAIWDKQMRNINNFLDALKNIETGKLLKKWTPSENAQNVWEFKLEYFDEKVENEQTYTDDEKKGQQNLLQKWRSFWECYLAVEQLMPECRFDWKYASSGGRNQSNLYFNLFNIVGKPSGTDKNQLWFLLDEPDNTFHPGWEREIILNLLKTCSIFNINFQLLISTHSPIMLSDVPKQAAILLKTDTKEDKNEQQKTVEKKEEKRQIIPKTSSFGQQIYTLFNDAFFMEDGVIGAFANSKIGMAYEGLCNIEKQLLTEDSIQVENKLKDIERNLKEYESTIKLIEEPLLHGHLSQSYKLCEQKINALQEITERRHH